MQVHQGVEALQSMLSWITSALSQKEQNKMMNNWTMLALEFLFFVFKEVYNRGTKLKAKANMATRLQRGKCNAKKENEIKLRGDIQSKSTSRAHFNKK